MYNRLFYRQELSLIAKNKAAAKFKGKEKSAKAGKCARGRPKESKNQKVEKTSLNPELLRIEPVLQAFLVILKGGLAI